MQLRQRLTDGITLIEMMLLCIMLAIIASISYVIYHAYSVKQEKIDQGGLIISNAIKFYKLDNGFYPTTAQGIAALVIKPTSEPIPEHWRPYLQTIPRDERGKIYHYVNPGKHHEFEVYSDE